MWWKNELKKHVTNRAGLVKQRGINTNKKKWKEKHELTRKIKKN